MRSCPAKNHDSPVECQASRSSLFSPCRVGSLELRNRFVVPGMQRGFVNQCAPTPEMCENLRGYGDGGAALIISESCGVDHPSAYWRPDFVHITAANVQNWIQVADAVKGTGAKFVIQLWHPGAMRTLDAVHLNMETASLSPSGLLKTAHPAGAAMTSKQLDEVCDAFVEAAIHAKSAGADGVEVHAAHGYLLDAFFWRETNLRQDEFGGTSLSERARYPAKIVRSIRQALGPEFLISIRFSQFKGVDYSGRIAETPEELADFLKVLRHAGVDCFNVSTRRFFTPEWPERDAARTLAGWVKLYQEVPVIGCGSIGLSNDLFESLYGGADPSAASIGYDLRRASEMVSSGLVDLLAIGRTHIANGDFVKKVASGRFTEIATFKRSVDLPDFA